jgi:hypothetical protein
MCVLSGSRANTHWTWTGIGMRLLVLKKSIAGLIVDELSELQVGSDALCCSCAQRDCSALDS